MARKETNLEDSKQKKGCIRKLVMECHVCTTNPKEIMTEIHNFYANLYSTKSSDRSRQLTFEFLRSVNTEILPEEQRECLDKNIAVNEYYEALKSFHG